MEQAEREIPLEQVNQFVLGKQHLTRDAQGHDLIRVVQDVGGLHATSSTAPYLSLWARMAEFSREDLDRELYQRHTLGKVRCVRRTIYVHSKVLMPLAWRATVGKLLPMSRRFMEARGVSGQTYEELARRILALLRGREMSAAEIRAALGGEVDLSPVLYYLCDQGILARGRPVASWKDRRQMYGVFSEWFPDVDLGAATESEAVTALVERYLAAFGPVTEGDVVWWTGLGKGAVRRALQELAGRWVELSVAGYQAPMLCRPADAARIRAVGLPDEPVVSLLPVLDSYLMGYKERGRYLRPEDAEYVFDRSGNATSAILVSGSVSGVWDFEDGDPPVVKLFLMEPVSPVVWERVRVAAQDVGRFMAEQDAELRVCDSMVPLTQRPAGHVMSPLKGC